MVVQTAVAESPRWTEGAAFFDAFRQHIPFDALALGIVQLPSPRLDEFLAVADWDDLDLDRWCRGADQADWLARAAREGVLELDPDEWPGLGGHGLVVALPESRVEDRWWTLLISRQGGGFTPRERKIANLIVNQWRVEFDQRQEPGMGKLLIGADDRLIYADPYTQVELTLRPEMLTRLIETLHTVVEQRWPQAQGERWHDYAIDLAGRPTWVCFRRRQVLGDPAARPWYVELRPLVEDELPVIGEIEDPRIAQAVAYLHDHFSQSPSLAEVSEAVHISPFHFHRLFTRAVGVSPKQYLQRKQLQVARWLLRATRVPIGAIAERTGFSSHGHFTATFHRVIGVSPTQYRDEHYTPNGHWG